MKQKLYFLNLLAAIILALTAAACKSSPPSANASVDSVSWAMLPFIKVDSVNPVLKPGNNKFVCPILKSEVLWEEKDVFNPAAIVRDGKVWMLYRAEDKIGKFAGTSRLGLAVSDDGLHFKKMPEPVKALIKTNYKEYKAEESYAIETINKEVFYRGVLEKDTVVLDLRMDNAGRIINMKRYKKVKT